MKKSFLLMMMVAGGFSALAQDTVTATSTNNLNPATNVPYMNTTNANTVTLLSTGDYSAYSAPANIQLYFTRDYPAVTTTVNWMPVGEWWRASYNDNGRYSHVFYTTNGDHYLVTLPVTETWVPDEVISAAASLYGPTVYDITALKDGSGNTVYMVRFLDNGVMKSEWINASGTKITEYWRVDGMDNNSANMNNNTQKTGSEIKEMKIKSDEDGTKIKVETKDGKETKTKIKNHHDH